MDKAKHTPTPWKTHIANDVLIVDVNGVDVAEICGEYDVDYEAMSDNAALIVRAVNSHDDLVKALVRLLANSEPIGEDYMFANAALANAALAKAKGAS